MNIPKSNQHPPPKTPLPKSKHHSYSLLSKIGHGNFGEVFLVQSLLNQRHYVIKVVII